MPERSTLASRAADSGTPAADLAEQQSLYFDGYCFDPASDLLYRSGKLVDLPQLPARALALLLAQAGTVVSHEQLHEALWPDRVVCYEQSLHTCIRQIRKALGDSTSQPRYIQTLPRRGYRFIAPLTATAVSSATLPKQTWQVWGWLIPAAAAISLLLTLLWSSAKTPADVVGAQSLAILPFEIMPDDPHQSTTLELALRERLATADPRHLQLIEAASVRAALRQQLPQGAYAELLGAHYLLRGSVTQVDATGEPGFRLQRTHGGQVFDCTVKARLRSTRRPYYTIEDLTLLSPRSQRNAPVRISH